MSTGDLLALLTAIVSGFAFIWSEKKELEARVRRLEDEHVFLQPWILKAKQKLQDGVEEWFL